MKINIKINNRYCVFIVFVVLLTVNFSYAEDIILDEPGESVSKDAEKAIEENVDRISNMLEKNIPTNTQVIEDTDTGFEGSLSDAKKNNRAQYNDIRSNEFSDRLGIVQKNILNKTHRIQVFGGLTLVPTDVYYRSFGGQLNVGYHFNEIYGVNLFGYFFQSSARAEVDQIADKQKIAVDSLLFLKNYYGLNLNLSTIYGKMTLFNQSITPFEIFFNLGAGSVDTRTSKQSVGLHAGLGSLYTLSKDSGVRFDLNWVFYKSKNLNGAEQNANSLMLTVGYSGFLLEGIN